MHSSFFPYKIFKPGVYSASYLNLFQRLFLQYTNKQKAYNNQGIQLLGKQQLLPLHVYPSNSYADNKLLLLMLFLNHIRIFPAVPPLSQQLKVQGKVLDGL